MPPVLVGTGGVIVVGEAVEEKALESRLPLAVNLATAEAAAAAIPEHG